MRGQPTHPARRMAPRVRTTEMVDTTLRVLHVTSSQLILLPGKTVTPRRRTAIITLRFSDPTATGRSRRWSRCPAAVRPAIGLSSMLQEKDLAMGKWNFTVLNWRRRCSFSARSVANLRLRAQTHVQLPGDPERHIRQFRSILQYPPHFAPPLRSSGSGSQSKCSFNLISSVDSTSKFRKY